MNKLKEVRKEKGMSRAELSVRSGVSYKLLWEYENGRREPSLATLRKITKALGCTIDDLLNGE